MLTRTFCHVPGLGGYTEKELWRAGCSDWECFLADPGAWPVGHAGREGVRIHLERSMEALAGGEHQFFREGLGSREAWRAWPEFRGRTLYLDIETDGGQGGESVTVIGLYDGDRFTALTKGEDLENFRDIVSGAGMLVTFFGSGFDLPMLRKAFPGLVFDQIHFDLCPALKRVGVRGGLKRVEREMGISRGGETDGLTGLDAIRLWREHLRGSVDALRILVDYNREDVVNLERLAEIAYGRLLEMTEREAGVGLRV